MRDLALFYLADPRFGGWVTFTVHLFRAMQERGWTVNLYKVGNRTEGRQREYNSGLRYRNVDLLEAEVIAGAIPAIVTAAGPGKSLQLAALLRAGAAVVVHDPTELTDESKPAIAQAAAGKVVVVREKNLPHLKALGIDAVYVEHPYVSHAVPASRLMHAVALSRLDWDKHTLEIVRANSTLPAERQVQIYGAENRLYTHHKIDKEFPAWREAYRGQFAAGFDTATRLAAQAKYMVDLSAIAGDGDGTQYTFLEAWDAGAILVVNAKWIVTGKGAVKPGHNALVVKDGVELADLLRHNGTHLGLVEAGREQLRKHAPKRVGAKYEEVLAS